MIRSLLWPPAARLLRSRQAAAAILGGCLVVTALAIVARHDGSLHGADRILIGPYGSIVLPLLAYLIVGAALGTRTFATSVAPLVALGAPPARVTLAAIGVCAAGCALASALAGVLVAAIAHGVGDPPRWADAAATAYAGALGGLAYATWFAFGASIVRGGGGRGALLVLDWIVGAGDGPAALFTPRAHVRNLLGGTAPNDLPQIQSTLSLVVICVACTALAALRCSSAAKQLLNRDAQ